VWLTLGVELDGCGVVVFEREWQPARSCGLGNFRFQPPPPSHFLLATPDFSMLRLRMATTEQGRRFKAPSYADIEDQRQVPPWWGRNLAGLGASVVPLVP
jgi:hypothetical protein